MAGINRCIKGPDDAKRYGITASSAIAFSVISMPMMGLLGSGICVTYSADPIAETEASPTIKEL